MTQRSQINISDRALRWFDQHGRKDLPWQQNITPYRVWVSEIMLQQTQVATVIPYFQRFMDALPTIEELAAATEDQVLHLWTGLGYYSRARNLHQAAKTVCTEYTGQLPDTVDALCELPGIGRSTAGAIVSIAFRKKAAILDGNVKRVLARHHAIGGWPGKSATLKQLWALAEAHTPTARIADYSQVMMDLGATLCTRSKPACSQCPLSADCLAYQQGNPLDYPGKKPKKALPIKTTTMLMIINPQGELLLEKRPATGIWGGLWIFPQLDADQDPSHYCTQLLGITPPTPEQWPDHRHTFSHYHLDISPVIITLTTQPNTIMEANQRLWYNPKQPAAIGLAAPIKTLMGQLNH